MTDRTLHEVLESPVSSHDQTQHNGSAFSEALRGIANYLDSTPLGRLSWPTRQPALVSFPDQAETLIIVPPFAPLYAPSLAAHTLQALAGAAGYGLHVLYANTLLAAAIGEDQYNEISWELLGPFVAERLFCRWAFDMPPLGHNVESMFELPQMFGEKQAKVYGSMSAFVDFSEKQRKTIQRLKRTEARMGDWLDETAAAILAQGYQIVGCTTTFEQTVCSIALLNRVKQLDRKIITIIGGANCDGEMAHGMASLGARVDYIFSGESDDTFPKFLKDAMAGRFPVSQIVYGKPCDDLETTPTPRFHEFFEQRERHLSRSKRTSDTIHLSYETSRGCWWGQKKHCTFCGLNNEGMASRRKSAERVMEELKALTAEYPTRNIAMTDAIMPHEYFNTLLPKLSREIPDLNIFYEQKANLSLHQVVALKEAGINMIQPGIEAMSSPMLQRMRKGLQVWQNLLLLRYARMAGLGLWWSILCGFPGDQREDYTETLKLVRLLHHLPPPVTLWHLIIDRFSPYFMSPDEFGVKDITPYPAYYDFFPAGADIPKLSYHFVAAYESAADHNLEVIRDLSRQLYDWRMAWTRPYKKRPELKIEGFNGSYILQDSRGIAGTEDVHELTRAQASHLLAHHRYTGSPEEDKAIDQQLAVIVDDWFIPLAVARIDLFLDLVADHADSKIKPDQLEPIGQLRDKENVMQGLVDIAYGGNWPALAHPLSPQSYPDRTGNTSRAKGKPR